MKLLNIGMRALGNPKRLCLITRECLYHGRVALVSCRLWANSTETHLSTYAGPRSYSTEVPGLRHLKSFKALP